MYYAVFILLAAGAWSVHLARADAAFRETTPAGVARAVKLLPGNTTYLAVAALQAEYDGRDPVPLLTQIAHLNPTVAAPRIRLGLDAEQRGDHQSAELWLREAFSVDHQFETRWTLANFYLRQNRSGEFWTWIRSALDISYGERKPAFDLCWRMSSDPQEILTRAIPDRVASDYFAYLMQHHPEALAGAAQKVHDQSLLLAAADLLLGKNLYADAVVVWRQAGRPAPTPPSPFAFDWQEIGVRHLNSRSSRSPGRIHLTGDQPESVELLRQFVGGLRPGTRYKLTWESTAEVPGVHWRINGEPTTEFIATAEVAVLSLWYQRPRGEVRAQATFDLSNVNLSALH